MQIIGFNFTKISAEKTPSFKVGSSINTDIEFTNIEEEKVSLLKDGSEALSASFRFTVSYAEQKEKQEKSAKEGELIFEGKIILSATKDEAKDLMKNWKNKELPNNFKMPIFNFLLKKCAPRALELEEELNLPSHIPIPQLHPQPPAQQQENKTDKKK